MSFGFSPPDAVNGICAVKTVWDALREDKGSKERVATASASVDHHLESMQNLQAVIDSTPDEVSASKTGVEKRVRALGQFQESRRSQLTKYKPWHGPFSGKKEFESSHARIASSAHAVQLDATLFTAELNLAETTKTRESLSQKIDMPSQELLHIQNAISPCLSQAIQRTAEASQSPLQHSIAVALDKTAQNLESTQGSIHSSQAKAYTMLKDMLQTMKCVEEKQNAEIPSEQPLSAVSEPEEDCKGSGKEHGVNHSSRVRVARHNFATELDTYIKNNGAVPLSDEIPPTLIGRLGPIAEQCLVPILVASVYFYMSRSRLQLSLQAFANLLKKDPVSAIVVGLVYMTVWRTTCRLSQSLSLLGADYITFEDAFGRSIQLPFVTAQYWTTFSGFIQAHFRDHPCFHFIAAGQFHLNLHSSRGRLITPQTWSCLMKPSANIAMSIFFELPRKACVRCFGELSFAWERAVLHLVPHMKG
ncbi:hypothetical protein AYO22_08850 [Fonsecaea multimorphosa]|nr:hypothetical protein AYO22_08850 [Fonsecaea multimorphosa]